MLCPTSGAFLDCFSDVLYAFAHASTIVTRSRTVQKVFVTPAAIAGVQRIAMLDFTKLGRLGVTSKHLTVATSGRPYLHPIYLPYPVKYFAARDRAPAPNTLAAALLPSSFRNKDFALFFSCSDTSA